VGEHSDQDCRIQNVADSTQSAALEPAVAVAENRTADVVNSSEDEMAGKIEVVADDFVEALAPAHSLGKILFPVNIATCSDSQ